MSYQQSQRNENPGKFFVGNLSWETDSTGLGTYFNKYGQVTDAVVITDRDTGRSRGFGFVTFQDPRSKDEVLSQEQHTIDGRTVNAKACNN